MESSVIIALVTAVTSIIVAFIQATTSLRVNRLKEPPVQPSAVPVQPWAPARTLSANRTWLWIGSILVITNQLWQLNLGTYLAGFLQFGATLWCTCLLAYFRPIRWAYVAGLVTLMHAIPLIIIYLRGGWNALDLSAGSLIYIANAILAAGIAYLSRRISSSTQASAM